MSRKKRILRVIGTIFLLALVGIGCGAWYLNWMMSQPLYTFGSAKDESQLRSPLEPPKQTGDKSWLVEPDIELAFDEYGNGTPVLVIHGGPGIPYGTIWKGLAPLTDTHRFLFYHQRGCGQSTRPIERLEGDYYSNVIQLDQTLGIAAQIADVERIRRILDQDKLTIIGHSFGGFLATMYAAEFPARVDKLVLVAPAGVLTPPSEETDIFALTRARLDKNSLAEFDAVKEEYFDFGNIFSKTDAELVDLHERMGHFIVDAMGYADSKTNTGPRSGGWAVFALYFSGGRTPNFIPALEEITAPTLILHGKDDDIAYIGSKSYQAIKGSRFVEVGRGENGKPAGHMVFDDSPAVFESAVRQFLLQ